MPPATFMLRGPEISLAESLLHANYSPLRAFQAVVDTASESSASALSNAVSTSIQKPRSGEWVASDTACKSELESAILRTDTLNPLGATPLSHPGTVANTLVP